MCGDSGWGLRVGGSRTGVGFVGVTVDVVFGMVCCCLGLGWYNIVSRVSEFRYCGFVFSWVCAWWF